MKTVFNHHNALLYWVLIWGLKTVLTVHLATWIVMKHGDRLVFIVFQDQDTLVQVWSVCNLCPSSMCGPQVIRLDRSHLGTCDVWWLPSCTVLWFHWAWMLEKPVQPTSWSTQCMPFSTLPLRDLPGLHTWLSSFWRPSPTGQPISDHLPYCFIHHPCLT